MASVTSVVIGFGADEVVVELGCLFMVCSGSLVVVVLVDVVLDVVVTDEDTK